MIIFVQDATADGSMFAPMFTSMFTKPVIGVVTKCDAASEEQIGLAKKYLEGAGAKNIFLTSAVVWKTLFNTWRITSQSVIGDPDRKHNRQK